MKSAALQPYQPAIQELFAYMNAYCGITKEEFKIMTSYFIVRKLDKKSLLIQPGEVDHYFNFIVSGVVRKFMRAGKKEFTLQLSTEGIYEKNYGIYHIFDLQPGNDFYNISTNTPI